MQGQIHGVIQSDSEFNKMLESSAAVIQEKRLSLEETERKAVRAALLEERGRFCLLARFLKPVLVSNITILFMLVIICFVLEIICVYIYERNKG